MKYCDLRERKVAFYVEKKPVEWNEAMDNIFFFLANNWLNNFSFFKKGDQHFCFCQYAIVCAERYDILFQNLKITKNLFWSSSLSDDKLKIKNGVPSLYKMHTISGVQMHYIFMIQYKIFNCYETAALISLFFFYFRHLFYPISNLNTNQENLYYIVD
ncbi:hypothetical protein RFI_29400 [Reticulomyxa filosa]|uniref:Uncharacterized protein n=1 Tax=Reticulomyxa filosa TaxID=46433 RepID=X6M4M3_RETFI|nr:hypothetical protein RFI_29400 [Reticulomyxa filosa]|eukprot:ETO07990.1 hypothetical protein RFI_29400 [Reticulomyxa filosa]